MNSGTQKEKSFTGIPAALFSFAALYFAMQQNALAQQPLALPQYQPQLDDDLVNFNLDQLEQNADELLSLIAQYQQSDSGVEENITFSQYHDAQWVNADNYNDAGEFETAGYVTGGGYSGGGVDAIQVVGVVAFVFALIWIVGTADDIPPYDPWYYYDDYHYYYEASYPDILTKVEVFTTIENGQINLDNDSYQALWDFEKTDDQLIWIESINAYEGTVFLTTEEPVNQIIFNSSFSWNVNDILSDDDFSIG